MKLSWTAVAVLACAVSALAAARSDRPAAVPPVTEKMRPIPWDPAPLPKVEIPADRPRIWFRAAQVPELRKRRQTTCAAAFEQIKQSVATVEGKSSSQAFNLAFLYQMAHRFCSDREEFQRRMEVGREFFHGPQELEASDAPE
jgi:hypothetical protein